MLYTLINVLLDDEIQDIIWMLNKTMITKEEKIKVMNSSTLFKRFLSTTNLTINSMDDLIDYYLEEEEVYVLNGGSYTWKIFQPSRYIGDVVLWETIKTAFNLWETITKNRFFYTPGRSKTDFNIGFGDGAHFTSSGYECVSFQSHVLGHAFFPYTPYAGEVHFNDRQRFFHEKQFDSYSLLHVAVHEIGHAIGLVHNERQTSIMYAREGLNKHLYFDSDFFDQMDRNQFL